MKKVSLFLSFNGEQDKARLIDFKLKSKRFKSLGLNHFLFNRELFSIVVKASG